MHKFSKLNLLRSDPMQAVRYTVRAAAGMSLLFSLSVSFKQINLGVIAFFKDGAEP